MRDLFRRGIQSVFVDGERDFVRQLQDRGMTAHDVPAARAAVESMVDTLVAFNRATQDESVALAVRALFPALVTYFFDEENLVASRGERLIFGLLDDAFLVHRAAAEVGGSLPGFNRDANAAHLAFLGKALPDEVKQQLVALVDETLSAAVSQAEQLGL